MLSPHTVVRGLPTFKPSHRSTHYTGLGVALGNVSATANAFSSIPWQVGERELTFYDHIMNRRGSLHPR